MKDLAGIDVVVVGGGLAGISAACALADRGARVRLLEARPQLGGATYSFIRGELTVDTGQHVFLRCYSAYRGLLERLGVTDLAPLQARFAIPVLVPRAGSGHEVTWLRRGPGPAPLHLAGSLARYHPLRPVDRLRLAPAAVALRSVRLDDPTVDETSFGDWLRRHGQSTAAIERLWALITVAALNLHPDEASLALAARVFQTALLTDPTAADIGVPAVSLRELHAEPAMRHLRQLGVDVRVKSKVTAVTQEPDDAASDRNPGFVVRLSDGELRADAVVVAVPHRAAASLVPATAAPDRDAWKGLGSSPIVNVHLRYDRTVMPNELPFVACVDSPAQWIFNRSASAGRHDGGAGQYLVVSVSAAHDEVATPAEELRTTIMTAVSQIFPDAHAARVLDAFVTREPHATFRQAPGTARLRPSARTALPGLVLAGAWTDTGWPDTMEGAVRSGLAAAAAITHPPSGNCSVAGHQPLARSVMTTAGRKAVGR